MYTPSAQPDFDALKSCWHPVALSEDVKNKPFSSRLLDEQIVVWRDAESVPHALADLLRSPRDSTFDRQDYRQ
jgi:phenylpropionate dioxygenase-like ring-hydroxylating dioxygenase large terminal subunit